MPIQNTLNHSYLEMNCQTVIFFLLLLNTKQYMYGITTLKGKKWKKIFIFLESGIFLCDTIIQLPVTNCSEVQNLFLFFNILLLC